MSEMQQEGRLEQVRNMAQGLCSSCERGLTLILALPWSVSADIAPQIVGGVALGSRQARSEAHQRLARSVY